MKREINIGIACAVLVAGCGTSEAPLHTQQNQPAATSTPDTLPQIDIADMPRILPANVAAQLGNVVAVRVVNQQTQQTLQYNGVRVGRDRYLSAGHSILHDDGSNRSDLNACGSVSVQTTTTKVTRNIRSTRGNTIGLHGQSLMATRHLGSYSIYGAGSVPDIALLQVQDTQQLATGADQTELNAKPLPIGTPLYVASYQTNADKRFRNPQELSYADVAKGSNRPAVYGGVVLGYWDNGNMVAAIGVRGYNAGHSDVGLLGDSGAPVYADGKLVGLSVRGSDPSTISRIAQKEGVAITGVDPKQVAELIIVQPFTGNTLSYFSAKISDASNCIE